MPKAVKRSLKTRLTDFEAPEVYTYSLESTIAEKFDAILKRMEATSRMKDFFDIYYLSSMFGFDGRKFQEAVWQTVQHRGTVYEENSFDRIAAFGDNTFYQHSGHDFNHPYRCDCRNLHLSFIALNQIT